MDFSNKFSGRVTKEMNDELTKDYIGEEIVEALSQMHPTKAPGPNGMDPVFYQRFWGTVERPTPTDVLQALNQGEFLSSLNHTFITLIPKKRSQ